MTAHPFPPIVRWILFPALAAQAGILATLAAPDRPALFFAPACAAAALSAVLSSRSWVAVGPAPFLAWAACVISERLVLGGSFGGWRGALLRLTEAEPLVAVVSVSILMSAAHALALQRAGRPWPQALAAYAGAALLACGAASPAAGLATLGQAGAFFAARTLARWAGPPAPLPPPVARWLLFPGLAGLAGAGVAGTPAWIADLPKAEMYALLGGLVAASSSLASVVSSRGWVVLAAAPAFALWGTLLGYAIAVTRAGLPTSPLDALRELLERGGFPLLVTTVGALATAAHAAAWRLDALWRWRRGLAIYGGAALFAGLLPSFNGWDRLGGAVTIGLWVLAQLVPARLAAGCK